MIAARMGRSLSPNKMKLAALGAGIGIIGGVGATGMQAYQTAKTNAPILRSSPFYNTSLMNADRLNASGDIVLGAHNSRRGR